MMNKPSWISKNEAARKTKRKESKLAADELKRITGILDIYNFEPRINLYRKSRWLVAIDKRTGKTLKEPGTRNNLTFESTDEAVKKILKLIGKGVIKA